MLESQAVPRELLVFRVCWNPKKWVLTPVKQCPRNEVDEFASENEDMQAKSKDSILSCPFM